ncbi:DNA-binding response regulator [Verrucomicrobia bacterium LW23]|nr:DNA-binding response regulator [Verrucomicrobia bacterium LW23]
MPLSTAPAAPAPKVLVIDDSPENIHILTETLEPHGYEVFIASRGEQGIKVAQNIHPDVILLDVVMPGKDGFSVCETLKGDERTRDIPIVFVTSRQEIESVLRGFEIGAADYIAKPFRMPEVLARIRTHSDNSRMVRELKERNLQLEAEIAKRRIAESGKRAAEEKLLTLSSQTSTRWGIKGLIGESPEARQIRSDIEKLQSFSNVSVLITGESGTGKELIARALHYGGNRREGAFIPINCAAIPAELTESVFFGHKKGAFTGATADRKGCFETADGGTLFLDEIGDMDLQLQAKLLRVLEDGEVLPVGANQTQRVDVRVVAATNADLQAKIAAGRFRQDLYYRLARYIIKSVPLRQRPEDVPLMTEHFLLTLAGEMGMAPRKITPDAQAMLNAYSFPGNVRELKNIIERALIESGGRPISTEHLYLMPVADTAPIAPMASAAAPAVSLPAAAKSSGPLASGESFNVKEAEEELIRRAMEATGGNVSEAAKRLGMHRSRLYRRLQA